MGHKGFERWWSDQFIGIKVLVVLGFVALGAGTFWGFGLLMVWLWNWLMPEIFGLPTIGFWQAWGLLALSSIFLKGFGGGSDESRGDRSRRKELRRMMAEERAREGKAAGDMDGEAPAP